MSSRRLPPDSVMMAIIRGAMAELTSTGGSDLYDTWSCDHLDCDDAAVFLIGSGPSLMLVCRPGESKKYRPMIYHDEWSDFDKKRSVVHDPDNSDVMRYAAQMIFDLVDWKEKP